MKPVAYYSRTLSSTEQNGAQIEKELLAGIYASEKFHIFLRGLPFSIETDLKTLFSLITSERSSY